MCLGVFVYLYTVCVLLGFCSPGPWPMAWKPCLEKLWSQGGKSHQVLGVEGHFVPPGGDKLIITVEDATVHVLIPPRVEEWFKPTQSDGEERERETKEGKGLQQTPLFGLAIDKQFTTLFLETIKPLLFFHYLSARPPWMDWNGFPQFMF